MSVRTVLVTNDFKLLRRIPGPSTHSDSGETTQVESWWGGLFSNLHKLGGLADRRLAGGGILREKEQNFALRPPPGGDGGQAGSC